MKHTHRKARIGLVLYILICMIFYALSQGASEIWAQESTAQAKTGDMTVTIYHTNDMHGALAASESSIGIDKVAAIKENTPGSILVDAGDATQGLPLASLTKGADVIKLMNIAGYDAMALGNHELDYGTTQLLQNASSAAFPILAANVFYNGSLLLKDTPSGNTGCHTIIERTIGTKTVKIGFFGLTTRETAAATNPTGIQGVTFEDEIQSAKKEIDELKKRRGGEDRGPGPFGRARYGALHQQSAGNCFDGGVSGQTGCDYRRPQPHQRGCSSCKRRSYPADRNGTDRLGKSGASLFR
ncbi:bifunctional metallophosphatase/5'-nucleotidase [Hominibacterium faecale]|uniref:bifunctional metallophosphatase/5'-nucleotidase n=1 Tax=Hominibacterium faecale TaxID=2839743 RepID=UPI0022B29812|nr:hypothetical protein [Hominibacterium faecale]